MKVTSEKKEEPEVASCLVVQCMSGEGSLAKRLEGEVRFHILLRIAVMYNKHGANPLYGSNPYIVELSGTKDMI